MEVIIRRYNNAVISLYMVISSLFRLTSSKHVIYFTDAALVRPATAVTASTATTSTNACPTTAGAASTHASIASMCPDREDVERALKGIRATALRAASWER